MRQLDWLFESKTGKGTSISTTVSVRSNEQNGWFAKHGTRHFFAVDGTGGH